MNRFYKLGFLGFWNATGYGILPMSTKIRLLEEQVATRIEDSARWCTLLPMIVTNCGAGALVRCCSLKGSIKDRLH